MSSFVLRKRGANTGDSVFDPRSGVNVKLISKIKLDDGELGNIGDGEFWIAKDPNEKFIIVNAFELIDIGRLV